MFCPNLSDPNIKAEFTKLENALPDYAYYLWDKYKGEIPQKYLNFSNLIEAKRTVINDQLDEAGFTPEQKQPLLDAAFGMKSPVLVFKGLDGKYKPSGERINVHLGTEGFFTSQKYSVAKEYDRGSGVAVYLYEGANSIQNFSLTQEQWENLPINEAKAQEVLGLNLIDLPKDRQGIVLFRTVDNNGDDLQVVIKNSDIKDNVALVKNGEVTIKEIAPRVMESRQLTPEQVVQRIVQEDIKKEKVKDLIYNTIEDPNYATLTKEQKRKYLSDRIFESEVKPLERRASVTISQDGTITLTPTEKTTKANPYKNSYDNFRGYAYSIVTNINRNYFNTSAPVFSKLTDLGNGKLQLELFNNNEYFENLVNYIDTVEQEFIAADVEATQLAEFLAKEHQALIENQQNANEMVIDGEVYPYDGSLLHSRLGVVYATANPQFEKYSKVLNFLATKFKGTSWTWDVTIPQAAQVDLATGQIRINPYMMKEDTPWHEFGHIVIRSIKQNNPKLFEELKEEVKNLHKEDEINSSYQYVRDMYPELALTEAFWEEAITTELGRQAALESKEREGLTLYDKIVNFFKNLFGINVSEKTSIGNLVNDLLSKEELDLINNQYSPEVTQVMYQRVIPEGIEDSMSSILKDVDKDPDNKFKSFEERVDDLASKISENDINQILNSNKFLQVKNNLLQNSLKQINRIRKYVDKKEAAAAFLELTDYVQTTNAYLRLVEKRLRDIEDSDKYSPSQKLTMLHFAQKQTNAYLSQVKQIEDLLTKSAIRKVKAVTSEEALERKSNALLFQLKAIRSTIEDINDAHKDRIIIPVANELWESVKFGNEEIQKEFNEEIERIEKGNARNKQKLIEKKKKERDAALLTKEKLIKLLQKPGNTGSFFFESAMLSRNPAIQIVSNYIAQGIAEANAQHIKDRNKLQSIQNKMLKLFGKFSSAVIDLKRLYKPYTRQVEYLYVEDGELKKKTVLALNTATDTVALQNKITELKFNLSKAETQEAREQIQEEIDQFYEKYTERPFTDEYYSIQEKLPLSIRKKRSEIYSKINEARELVDMEDTDTSLAVERIRELYSELDDMERLYDSKGNKKTGQDLADAQAIIEWKKDKKAREMVSYELNDAAKVAFEKQYEQRLRNLNIALSQAKTEEEREAAQNEFDAWASINVRTTYKQEFYDLRQDLLDEISYLLQNRSNSDLDSLYDELFNLLKGNRDSSGAYVPSNYSKEILAKSKEIEEKIEDVKSLLKKDSPLDPAVKKKLGSLIAQLQKLQSTAPSAYYMETVEKIKSEIRAEVTEQNPELEDVDVERLVNKQFKNSDWYKANHITKKKYNEDLQTVEDVEEPIFVWRVTSPNHPDFIEKNQPGFNWYTAKVNPKYLNTNYKSGNIQFKEVGKDSPYYNKNHDTITDEQKSVLQELREYYYETQDGLYSADKLHDIIPGLSTTNFESFLDTVQIRRNPIKSLYKKVSSWFGDSEIIEDESDQYGTKEKELLLSSDESSLGSLSRGRKLFMKHSKPLDVSEQSFDIMSAIANYSMSAAKFKAMKNMQSVILSTEEVAKDQVKTHIGKIIDRTFYGKTLEGEHKIHKILNGLGRALMKFGGSKVLQYNTLSIVPNWTTGIKNNYALAKANGLTTKQMNQAFYDASMTTKNWVLYGSQLGNKTLDLQLMEYFATEQKDLLAGSRAINNTALRKYGDVTSFVSSLRDFTEYQISAQNTYAFLNKYRVKLKNSDTTIPLKDAFELKDGTIALRDDVEVSEDLIKSVRNKIYVANRRSQGVYDTLSQPEYYTNVLFRMAIFLKKWVVPDLKTAFGSETIHYGAGIKTVGSYKAFWRFMRDSAMHYNMNLFNSWSEASSDVKGGVRKATFNFAVFLALTNLLRALYKYTNCEEDAEADWADYACYFTKRVVNEAEGITTPWGINEFRFTYFKEMNNGVTWADKLVGQMLSPVTIFRAFQTDENFWSADPYYRYNRSKVDWDKTHPGLAGRAGYVVLMYELMGARGLMLDAKSMEFNNRRFNDYAPKTYTKELITRYTKDHEGLELMKQRTPLYQTKRQFKKQIKEIKEKARRAKETRNVDQLSRLKSEYNILIQNYKKRIMELKSKGNKVEDVELPYIPFFDNRKGLDLSVGDIDTEDLE